MFSRDQCARQRPLEARTVLSTYINSRRTLAFMNMRVMARMTAQLSVPPGTVKLVFGMALQGSANAHYIGLEKNQLAAIVYR